MRLEYQCVDALPRLAWCARLREGDDTIQVLHGPWIEAWPDRFCEGAWDGPFSDGCFVDALTLTGSGGCLSNGGIVFASPTNLLARIYSVRDGNRLLVSNSLVFLLAQTDDALDITHPHYYFDFLRHKRGGLARPTSTIRTARRNRLSLHQHTNLFVRSDLSRREQSKRLCPAP